MDTVLNMKVGTKKINAVIKDIQLLSVLRKNNTLQQKIVFKVIDEVTKLEYNVSDAWITVEDELCVRALWFYETPNGIYSHSTLAEAMRFYNIKVLRDFIGKIVKLYPDKNDYLTLVITNDIK